MSPSPLIRQRPFQSCLPPRDPPQRYEISLKPDLIACKFAGSVRITIDVASASRFLVLNVVDRVIDKLTTLHSLLLSWPAEKFEVKYYYSQNRQVIVTESSVHTYRIVNSNFQNLVVLLTATSSHCYRIVSSNSQNLVVLLTESSSHSYRIVKSILQNRQFKYDLKIPRKIRSEILLLTELSSHCYRIVSSYLQNRQFKIPRISLCFYYRISKFTN